MRRHQQAQGRALPVVVVLSGCLGATAGCAPVGSSVADHLLTGALAAAVAWAAASAPGLSLIFGAAVVVAAGDSLVLRIIGLGAFAAIVLLERDNRPHSPERALVGAVIVQALLRLPWSAPARGSALVALVGMAPILVLGVLGVPARVRRIVVRSSLVVAAFAVVATAASLYAVVHSHTLLTTGETNARAAVDAARAGNRGRAASEFAVAEGRFDDARNLLGSWSTWPARQLPLVGPQLRVLDRVATLGADTIPIARVGVTKVDPDRLRLVDGRLDLTTVAAYRPIFDRVAAEAHEARAQMARLPRVWLLPQFDRPLARFAATVAKADDSAHTGAQAIARAPSILGASGPRTYLVAIVTPAEARGSGGFMANYGVLTAVNGRLHLDKVGRGPDLNAAGVHPKRLTGPPDYLARYRKFDPAGTWENVTMSPDFPSVANVMAQLYPQSGGVPIDGVVRLDPVALSGLLQLTGPVHVPGLPVTLDAHNVVQFLLRDEYTLITDNKVRSNLLGDVARAVFDRLTTGHSAQPSKWGNALSPAIRTGNLALWFRDAPSQALVRRIGADAALPPVNGDSFGVVVQNGGGNKIDYYLHRRIGYTATVDGATGNVRARAVVTLRNGAPASGLPDYVIANGVRLPVATNRLYLSLFSSFALEHTTLDGRPFALLAERERGRNVYSAFVDIPPGATRTVVLDLRGTVDLAQSRYRFDYLPQTLPNADRVEWSIRTPDAYVVAASTRAATPIPVTIAARSATARSSARGAWSIEVRLRR